MATTQVMRSERFPDLGDEVLFPRLSDDKRRWLAKRGERRTFEPGEVLYEHAVPDAPFYVIESELVELVDRKPGKDVYVAQADSRTFIGDIAAFTGEPTISACVAVEATKGSQIINLLDQGVGRVRLCSSTRGGTGLE